MPTREVLASFWRDWDLLSSKQQREFRAAVAQFIAWAYDGRATFQYGEELHPGQPHIIWRRVGTHAIFRRP